jgi:predicted lipid-binding transport protein (Tim44 family)
LPFVGPRPIFDPCIAADGRAAGHHIGPGLMEGFQFIDIIILAMVAGFIILRLRSTLGRRTGHDPRTERVPAPGYPRDASRPGEPPITLPNVRRVEPTDIEPAYQGTPLEAGLVQIKATDPSFSATRFLEGAAKAFEIIVGAFARHDTDTLKPLLSPEVFSGFAAAIQDREERGETLESELVVLKPPKLESVEVQHDRAIVAVRFQSEQVNIVKDKNGNVIEGDRNHVESVTDIWTFARELSSRDPNWVLISTSSVE